MGFISENMGYIASNWKETEIRSDKKGISHKMDTWQVRKLPT